MTREVLSVRSDARLEELAALFSRSGFDLLPVVAPGMLLQGVVTRTDLLAHLLSAPSPRALAQRRGGPVTALLRPVAPLLGADRLAKAARRLSAEGLPALPVADGGGRLTGILSRADLVRHAGALPVRI